MTRRQISSDHIDRAGISVSAACAIHCAIVPLGTTVLPMLGIGFLVDARVEWMILSVSVLLATGSVCWGFHQHRQRKIFVLFGAALVSILLGHAMMTGIFEVLLVMLGGCLFVCAHRLNTRLCQACRRCDDYR
jgi:hypothetical protein